MAKKLSPKAQNHPIKRKDSQMDNCEFEWKFLLEDIPVEEEEESRPSSPAVLDLRSEIKGGVRPKSFKRYLTGSRQRKMDSSIPPRKITVERQEEDSSSCSEKMNANTSDKERPELGLNICKETPEKPRNALEDAKFLLSGWDIKDRLIKSTVGMNIASLDQPLENPTKKPEPKNELPDNCSDKMDIEDKELAIKSYEAYIRRYMATEGSYPNDINRKLNIIFSSRNIDLDEFRNKCNINERETLTPKERAVADWILEQHQQARESSAHSNKRPKNVKKEFGQPCSKLPHSNINDSAESIMKDIITSLEITRENDFQPDTKRSGVGVKRPDTPNPFALIKRLPKIPPKD